MESKNEMLVNTKQFEKYVNRIEHGGGRGRREGREGEENNLFKN